MRTSKLLGRLGVVHVTALGAAFVACGPTTEDPTGEAPYVAYDAGRDRAVDGAPRSDVLVPVPDAAGPSLATDAGSAEDATVEDGGSSQDDASAPGDDSSAVDSASPPPVNANPDSDLALVRFDVSGVPDETFGTHGVSVIDLGTGYVSGQTVVRDTAWSLARDATGRFLVFGGKKGSGVRVDLDRVVVRATPGGAIDTTFGSSGIYTFNLANQDDQAKGGLVQAADGKIVTAGFTSVPTGVGTQVANRVILIRQYDPGTLDKTFGAGGVVSSAPFAPVDPVNTPWGTQEIYGLGRQSSGGYVAGGLGRATSAGAYDVVAFRYTAGGALDATWGSKGVFALDVAGDNDRGRNLVVLPDDRVLVVGSGTPIANVVNTDALIAVAAADGTPDTTFAPRGLALYDFGAPDESFYGGALAPSGAAVAAVGYRAGAGDDDATLLLLPLGSEAGAGLAKAVPLSASENDRFWSVAFDGAGQIYAAGFVSVGGDTRVAVARFDAIGTLDATYGTGGIAMLDVVPHGGTVETARGIVVQPDGKVVVVCEIEHL